MTIHLLNPLWHAWGGSEWRTLCLHDLLATRGEVRLWSEAEVAPEIRSRMAVHRIGAEHYPEHGTLLIVGVYFIPGEWLRRSRFERVIVLYNTSAPQQLGDLLGHLARAGIRQVEIVYASEGLRQGTGLPGIVQISPLDPARFRPAPRTEGAPFTVGRHSRDEPYKHHDSDIALYRHWAQAGCRVRLMGATCLREQLDGVPGIELLPCGAEPAEIFLQSLDCFFYRVAAKWWESHGRVVHEALCTGLPVVCHRDVGIAQQLRHDENVLLFARDEEALAAVEELRRDSSLRSRLATAARSTGEFLLRPAALDEICSYYLAREPGPQALEISPRAAPR